MHIDFRCSGGYGGLRLTYQCETDTLPADESKTILELIAAARALELDPNQISSKSRSIPDDFVCQLTLSDGELKNSLSFNELSAPKNLRRLSAYLRKLAIKQQGQH
ncbi:MAG: hypothetical protein PVI38_16025 [Desulfobacterales bacterium]